MEPPLPRLADPSLRLGEKLADVLEMPGQIRERGMICPMADFRQLLAHLLEARLHLMKPTIHCMPPPHVAPALLGLLVGLVDDLSHLQ